ncbi:MAG: hypothetical protein AAGJ54_05725 [Planctomycetota bacterium]
MPQICESIAAGGVLGLAMSFVPFSTVPKAQLIRNPDRQVVASMLPEYSIPIADECGHEEQSGQ